MRCGGIPSVALALSIALGGVALPAGRTALRYAPGGQLLSAENPDWSEVYTLDGNGRRTRIRYTTLGASVDVTYDGAGRVTALSAPGGTLTYRYDQAARLSAVGLSGSAEIALSHDAQGRLATIAYPNGLRAALVSETPGQPAALRWTDGAGTTLAGSDGAAGPRPHAGPTALEHDSAGRIVAIGARRFAYDARGHMIRATTLDGQAVEIVYDAEGRPVRRKSAAGILSRLYWKDRPLADVGGPAPRLYVFHPETRSPLAYAEGDEVIYLLTDLSGTPFAAADADGRIVEQFAADTFGRPTKPPSRPFFFQGEIYHASLGLYAFGSRWYAPDLGLFLAPEPVTAATTRRPSTQPRVVDDLGSRGHLRLAVARRDDEHAARASGLLSSARSLAHDRPPADAAPGSARAGGSGRDQRRHAEQSREEHASHASRSVTAGLATYKPRRHAGCVHR
jgi:RHS repeat-associated protein